MSATVDLPNGFEYVAAGLIWHITRTEDYRPESAALCGKTPRRGQWDRECQGAWPVAKLCRTCRDIQKRVTPETLAKESSPERRIIP